MAHPAGSEATDLPLSASEKVAEFEKFLYPDEDEEEAPAEVEEGAEEGDDLDLEETGEEEQDDEESEPEAPVIDAPVSLNAEEKVAFAAASPEVQQAWAAAETRRNADVTKVTTRAAEAQRAAETAAASADAQAKLLYSQQLAAVADALMPQEPNANDYGNDQISYLTACRQYDQQVAQYGQFMQQVAGMKAEAQTKTAQIDDQARAADLMTVPKLANPDTRESYVKDSLAAVQAIGLDPQAFELNASSADFRALDTVMEWKAKAERFDKAMSKQMQRVRSGKTQTLRPSAAPHADTRAASSSKAWQRVKSAGNNKAAQNEALADWLEASGNL